MDWFRLYGEFATDAKVQSMPEAMQRRLIMIMCMRCSDVLATLQDDEMAFALRISDDELAESKALFMRKGFIDSDWNLMNWDKRQYVSDSSTERSRRHREKKKEGVQQVCNVAATPPETDTEADTEADKQPNPIGLVVVSPAADQPDPCPHKAIIALYHEHLPASPAIRDWTAARAETLRTRWKEDKTRQDLDWWTRFFQYIADSPFLTGKVSANGRKPFCPGLEWICKAENFAKIREGRYHEDIAA